MSILPPVDDSLTESQLSKWTSIISQFFTDAQSSDEGERKLFVNPAERSPAHDSIAAKVSWVAFPRRVKLQHPTNQARWKAADATRDVQDEYCEWSVTRNAAGKITKVELTCEGPEYWQFLAKQDPNKALKLYQKHVNSKVTKADIFDSHGNYIPRNKFNTDTSNGAMHLVQINNSLAAEVQLAGDATVVRSKDGGKTYVTDPVELCNCSQYGQASRNSDPLIGISVNQLIRDKKCFLTLQNPVGLFINSFNPIGWVTPDGSNAANYWKITRGTAEHPVRAIYEVPPSAGFTVSDIKINGININYGSQVIDAVQIKLTAVIDHIGKGSFVPLPCRKQFTAALSQYKVSRAGAHISSKL